jgi:hypothetical protein
MPCTFAFQCVSKSAFACTEWKFVPRQSRAALRLSSKLYAKRNPDGVAEGVYETEKKQGSYASEFPCYEPVPKGW